MNAYLDPRVAETHISVLFFLGDRVYKLKKAVDFGFLDFTTLEAREAACRREVQLNRRLSPDVYLDVLTLTGADRNPCDYLVVMRRMPEERRLATMLAADEDVTGCVEQVAQLITSFHARAETSEEIAAGGSFDSVLRNWSDNFDQMQRFIGNVLPADDFDRVRLLALRYLEGRRLLLEQRIREGKVRDGHGDLLAEDIFCLDDGPRILDCIEFNDRFRHTDVLADIAFLAMDLERLGRADLGTRVLEKYRELSRDTYPASLADHYVAYRAHVRSKIACLRSEQGDAASVTEARSLLDISLAHLERARTRMVLIGGLPGTGKSTLALALGEKLGWKVLRSDEIRKQLAGVPDRPAAAPWREGIYSQESTERTYRRLLEEARRHLELGESVLLDASWSDRRRREEATSAARDSSSDLVELQCRAPASVAADRMKDRSRRGDDPSDGTPQIAEAMALAEHEWPTAVRIDTAGDLETSARAALVALETT